MFELETLLNVGVALMIGVVLLGTLLWLFDDDDEID